MHGAATPESQKVTDDGALSGIEYEWDNDGSGRLVRLTLSSDNRLTLMKIYLALDSICDIIRADLGVMEQHTTDM